MVAKALFSFQVNNCLEIVSHLLNCPPSLCISTVTLSHAQAQNNRELSFRKGDVIYIKKQVDNNWYEGERHATVGIFPVTYVEILPSGSEVSTLQKKEANTDGQAKAKFNFTAQTPMELSLIKGRHVPPRAGCQL